MPFNMVCRGSLLREVRAKFPGLACWADWCYGSPSTLRFGQHKLQSCCGVQQGDPLGPLLFALALHPALRAAARHPVELCFSYLDDVVLAGRSHAVQAAFRDLQAAAAAAGLLVEVSKCVLVPTAGQASCVDASAFPSGLNTREDGNFELLGAPIGDPEFCESYTAAECVDKSTACLAALADLEDSQTGLLLLRYCSSFSKVVYSMHTTPPAACALALQRFDEGVKACLEHVGGLPLTDRAWQQATLSIRNGGLGLRQAALHSPAAYLASVGFSTAWCQELDARYATDWPTTTASVERFNAAVLAADRITAATVRPPRQQDLSACLDKAQLAQLSVSASGEAERAHLQLLQQPGAGAWLSACPSEALGLHLEAPFFRVLLRMRLRLPVASTDGFCPLCDGTADRFGDHARACPCGGDRVKRHNRLRTVVATRAASAGLSPEVEKLGLLPPRPADLGACETGSCQPSGRRPADVYLPAWGIRGPAAFDLAVTSGLKSGSVALSALHAGKVAAGYEDRKRSFQDTETLCRGQGLQFVPLVAEGIGGGWGPTAVKTWRELGGLYAARLGLTASEGTEQLLQALSVTLQRENARAVLRRLPEAGEEGRGPLPEP